MSLFYKKSNNKYRETTYEKEERNYYGAVCNVCGKPLSKQRPVCFSCPIHPLEYYERKQKEREDNQI
jgi:uncharacterized OB-fold protein